MFGWLAFVTTVVLGTLVLLQFARGVENAIINRLPGPVRMFTRRHDLEELNRTSWVVGARPTPQVRDA